jgi:ribosomal protein S18 acetylase RimI-like enzyme
MIPFDKSAIHLAVPSSPGLELRSATAVDLERLRQWKNAQRQFFFHQEEISESQQRQWFDAFMSRPYDLMLLTVFERRVFGCMGIRWQASHWDVYNVILGLPDYGKRGLMGQSFAALLDYAVVLKPGPITLQVLKNNPAISWYQKQGFRITEIHETYFSMLHQPNREKEATP